MIDFTDKELDGISDALGYLLGAELLEENGYTEGVINALESAKEKVDKYLRENVDDSN